MSYKPNNMDTFKQIIKISPVTYLYEKSDVTQPDANCYMPQGPIVIATPKPYNSDGCLLFRISGMLHQI